MIKKIILGVVATFIIISGVACDSINTESETLRDIGLSAAAKLDIIAESDDYVSFYTASPEIIEITKDIASQDFTTPKAIYSITGLEDTLINQISSEIDMSPEVMNLLKNKYSTAFATQLNAVNGSDYIVATSIINHSESFAFDGLSEPTTYIYFFDGDYCVVTNFIPYDENSVVAMYATIAYNNSLVQAIESEELTETLDSLGFSGLTAEKIE